MARSPELLDHCLTVETASVHRVQESHLLAYHVLWDLVHTLLADARVAAPDVARKAAATRRDATDRRDLMKGDDR